MHLEKSKAKKGRIELEEGNYLANWTQGMIVKISQINGQQWGEILAHNCMEKIRKIEGESEGSLSTKLCLQS